ncbi:RluA family pseudouridine synthase [Hydrogenimonas sp.]
MSKNSLIACSDERLDKLLHRHIGGSRNQIEHLIKRGFVEVGGKKTTKAGHKVRIGEMVAWQIPPEPSYERGEVDFDIPIIYEDDDILVINKPSGVIVHPAPSVKEATLVDWLKFKGVSLSTISGEERHGIVHRLDKETSGAMVVAKNNAAHEKLSRQLQDKSMGRYYIAIVDYPLKDSTIVEGPIARNRANRLKMGIVSGGKPAKTAFLKLLGGTGSFELVGAKLFSGRTHQIRVHLESIGRHIAGDHLYGFKSHEGKMKPKIERILLHAYVLYLKHPATGETMRFVAEIPLDMMTACETYFEKEKLDEVLDPRALPGRFDDVCSRVRTKRIEPERS